MRDSTLETVDGTITGMVDILISDFNGASRYFDGPGYERWAEVEEAVLDLVLQLQPSDQAGRDRSPIFDPKATNAALTSAMGSMDWTKVSVPQDLQPFGLDWDGGKGEVLVEYQFSNYPFLWNNIIRTEAVYKSAATIAPLTGSVGALIIITKSGSLPASNSTLYFEQARAQIDTVTRLDVFEIPIRLVGITVGPENDSVIADWNEYPGRYSRQPAVTTRQEFEVVHGRARRYGNVPVRFV